MSLEVLQSSQENTCARVSFLIEFQAAYSFFKKEKFLMGKIEGKRLNQIWYVYVVLKYLDLRERCFHNNTI